MKKLRLDVKDLRINSFEPATHAGAKRGTVFGQETCGTGESCVQSCITDPFGWTCDPGICSTTCEAHC